MKDRNARLFSKLTDMSDDLVEESMILPEAKIRKPRRGEGWFASLMSSPVAAAVLSGVVSLTVLALIIMAGQHDPFTPAGRPGESTSSVTVDLPDPSPFEPFYMGMTEAEMMAELGDTFFFRYINALFVPRDGNQFLLIQTDREKITDLTLCDEKVPTHEDFAKVENGMDLAEVSALIGRPEGSYTSGVSALAYRTAEGAQYYVYLHGEGGTVSDVVWVNKQPLKLTVTYNYSIRPVYEIEDSIRVKQFHDYFANVYAIGVSEDVIIPPDSIHVATFSILYEDGETKTYLAFQDYLSYDGGQSWGRIQKEQPFVTVTLQELVASLDEETVQANVFILWVGEDGFWGYFAELGAEVYVKMEHDFQLFDTVRITYLPSQLKHEEGSLGENGVNSFYYTYVLENPLDVQLSAQQMRREQDEP